MTTVQLSMAERVRAALGKKQAAGASGAAAEPRSPRGGPADATPGDRPACATPAAATPTPAPCPKCLRRAKQDKVEQEAWERRKAAGLRRCADGSLRRPHRKQLAVDGGRLPDGATFLVSYDAVKGEWSGTLAVPSPGGEVAFEGAAAGGRAAAAGAGRPVAGDARD